MDLLATFDQFEKDAIAAIDAADSADALEEVRIQFLGKKKGRLRDLQAGMKNATPEERPVVGKKFNEAKNKVQAHFDSAKSNLDLSLIHI